MWFADLGVELAWLVLVVWALAVALVALTTPPRRPVPRSRVTLLVGGGAGSVLFAAQSGVVDFVADVSGAGGLDASVLGWFVDHRTPAATAVLGAVSTVGGTAGMAVLALLGAVVLWLVRRRGEAAVVVVAAVGAALLVAGFKALYRRPRPPVADRLAVETNAALPSGHALGSVVVLGVLAAAVLLLARRPAIRRAALAAAAVAVAAIGVSRLYLGVHWATDVLTGWLLGGAWLAVCVTALVLIRPAPAPVGRP